MEFGALGWFDGAHLMAGVMFLRIFGEWYGRSKVSKSNKQ
jgi:hypothetical protein